MAVRKRRSLWGSISTSTKMYDKRMCRDARTLFLLMIAHQDDEGRLDGHPQVIKASVCPMEDWTTLEVEELLKTLKRVRLIDLYGSKGVKVAQISDSGKYQTFKGIHKIASSYPPPPHRKGCPRTPDTSPKLSKEKLREEKLREEVIDTLFKVVDNFSIYENIDPKDLTDLIGEFPNINPVTLFNDLYTWESAEVRNTSNPLLRIRNFFKTASKPDKPIGKTNIDKNAEILGRYQSGESNE